jgi:hypothetical protein
MNQLTCNGCRRRFTPLVVAQEITLACRHCAPLTWLRLSNAPAARTPLRRVK